MNRLGTVQAKFVLWILPVVILVAVLFSVILGYQDFRILHQALQTKEKNLPRVYSVALAALSENFKPAWISRVIGSLTLDPDVASATVYDDEDTVLAQVIVVSLAEGEKRSVVDQLIVDDTLAGRLTIKGKIRVAFHERTLNSTIEARVKRSVVLILVLVTALFLAALIANRIIIGRPLDRFLHAIRRADEEQRPEPVAWTSRDEIGRVIAAYNKLLEKLLAEEAALRERSEDLGRSIAELRALNEVGQAVSSTLDLDKVLLTIITRAVELSKADAGGTIYEFNEATEVFEPRANYRVGAEMLESLRESKLRMGETAVGRCALERTPIQIADLTQVEDYRLRSLLLRDGVRAVVAVPLLREDRVIGALVIRRGVAGALPAATIALLQTFAAQSVLAIENARLFRDVQNKSRDLEIASRHKSQFLANMSHELRTPLNAIIGMSEMLIVEARDIGGGADQVEPLERILRAGKHLLALINDILDLSKIEAGRMELELASFPFEPVVRDVARTVESIAEKNGNRVVVECATDLGAIVADQTRVRQVLLNLASNAVKFTDAGTVTIRALRLRTGRGDRVRVSVSDTGIGMTPEQIGRLFQEFVQADASTTRKFGGTGLGLAISQRFCRMMGGDIEIKSELGSGSTFTMDLPACVGAHSVDAVQDSIFEEAVGSRPVASGALVLAVDDDPVARDVMANFIARLGYRAITAGSGAEALKLARELRPSAITLDVMMPGMDGWEVLAALKGEQELADIPVIMLTIVDDKAHGYVLGASDYLVKPLDREQMGRALQRVCGAVRGCLLLVEDEAGSRQATRRFLEREGWLVDVAGDGGEALGALERKRPDAIILDLLMPGMNGFEFLAALRGEPRWADIPVIVLTAKDVTQEERVQLRGGVRSILRKQASEADDLLREVARLLGRAGGAGRDWAGGESA